MVKKILPFLTLFFVVVMIVSEVKDRQMEIDDFNKLADLVQNITPTDDTTETTDYPSDKITASEPSKETEEPKSVFTRNLAPLIEKNADCIGWVHINDTAVDYPVMHTPKEPKQYLRLNFDKEYSTAGVPFLKGACTLESDNFVIYGILCSTKNKPMCSFPIDVGSHLFFSEICLTHETTHEILDCAKIMEWI